MWRSSALYGVGTAALLLSLSFSRQEPRPRPQPLPTPQAAHAQPGIYGQVSVELLAVGDVMMHADVKAAAEADPRGFLGLWSDLIPAFQQADLVFGNLETPVAPRSGGPGRPFQFNAPEGLPAALKASGFAVLSSANNHAFDQGRKGVVETLERLRAAELLPVGSGVTKADAEAVRIVERKGLRIAFLGGADIFNSDLNRKATEPYVRPLDFPGMLDSVRAARSQADLVVVSLHWGIEEHHDPTPRQKAAAAALVAAGADLVLGHHPHVLQPMSWILAGGRTGLVVYSMGNFISNQNRSYAGPPAPVVAGDERDGMLLRLRLVKDARGARVASAGYEPLWVANNWGQGRPRIIRVQRLLPMLGQAEADLAQLGAAQLPDPKALAQAQLAAKKRLELYQARRARIASIVGGGFEEAP